MCYQYSYIERTLHRFAERAIKIWFNLVINLFFTAISVITTNQIFPKPLFRNRLIGVSLVLYNTVHAASQMWTSLPLIFDTLLRTISPMFNYRAIIVQLRIELLRTTLAKYGRLRCSCWGIGFLHMFCIYSFLCMNLFQQCVQLQTADQFKLLK